jgi:uncharacterized protein involved in exopolysaccharide biosynthesis
MTIAADPVDDIDFSVLVAKLRRNWSSIALCMAVGLALGVLFMHGVAAKYSAELRVTAADTTSQQPSGRSGGLGGIAALAGVSLNSQDGASPFQLYINGLSSRALADQLARDKRIMRTIFHDEWDRDAGRWVKPAGVARTLLRTLKGLAGSDSIWRAPDAARLQQYLDDEIEVVEPGAKAAPITVISYHHSNPDFARYMLDRINAAADMIVRRQAQARASSNIRYLSQRLETIALPEHRRALADSLAAQEQALMIASSSLPYSLTVVQAPTASGRPVWPDLGQALATGLLLGALAGATLALCDIRPLRRRQPKEA